MVQKVWLLCAGRRGRWCWWKLRLTYRDDANDADAGNTLHVRNNTLSMQHEANQYNISSFGCFIIVLDSRITNINFLQISAELRNIYTSLGIPIYKLLVGRYGIRKKNYHKFNWFAHPHTVMNYS